MAWDVVDVLLKAALVAFLYRLGKEWASFYQQRWRNYATLLGGVLFFSMAAWSSYGEHSEDENSFRPSPSVTDFVPTNQERNQHAMVTLLVLATPSFLGLYAGHQARPRQDPEVVGARSDRSTSVRGESYEYTRGPSEGVYHPLNVPHGKAPGPGVGAMNKTGVDRMDLFVRGSSSTLQWKSYDGSLWGAWTDLGTPTPSQIDSGGGAVWWQSDAQLDVFVRGSNGHLYQTQSTNGSTWGVWNDLGAYP